MHEIEDAQVVRRLLGADGELDHVAVLLAHALVDLLQIGGQFLHVVVADDAFDVLEAADAVGDVGLEIDPVEAADDALAQQRQTSLLGAGPATAVLRPPHGRDHRTRLVQKQPLEVGRLFEEVEVHLDQAGAAFGRLLNLGLNHLVPRPADDHAQVFRRRRLLNWFRVGHDSPFHSPSVVRCPLSVGAVASSCNGQSGCREVLLYPATQGPRKTVLPKHGRAWWAKLRWWGEHDCATHPERRRWCRSLPSA